MYKIEFPTPQETEYIFNAGSETGVYYDDEYGPQGLNLEKDSIVLNELYENNRNNKDHVHLSRFQLYMYGTNEWDDYFENLPYIVWSGRCSNGFHRHIGRIMKVSYV